MASFASLIHRHRNQWGIGAHIFISIWKLFPGFREETQWDKITTLFYQSDTTVVATVGDHLLIVPKSPTVGDPGLCRCQREKLGNMMGKTDNFLFTNLSINLKVFILLRKHWKCSCHNQGRRGSHDLNISKAQALSQGNLLTQFWTVCLQVDAWNSFIKLSVSGLGQWLSGESAHGTSVKTWVCSPQNA